MSPVLEELPDHRHWQFALAKLGHERTIVNFLVPGFVERRVKIVHVCFGFRCGQFFSGSRFFRFAQVLPPRTTNIYIDNADYHRHYLVVKAAGDNWNNIIAALR